MLNQALINEINENMLIPCEVGGVNLHNEWMCPTIVVFTIDFVWFLYYYDFT